MILCENVRIDLNRPACADIDCLMGKIKSLEEPPFPLLQELICVYLVLTECYGSGTGEIRVVYVDGEQEQLVFSSPQHPLDFAGHSPLELLGVVFRVEAREFPQSGRYAVQFRYNGAKLEERPLLLRRRPMNDKSGNEGVRIVADFRDRAIPSSETKTVPGAAPSATRSVNEGVQLLADVRDRSQALPGAKAIDELKETPTSTCVPLPCTGSKADFLESLLEEPAAIRFLQEASRLGLSQKEWDRMLGELHGLREGDGRQE